MVGVADSSSTRSSKSAIFSEEGGEEGRRPANQKLIKVMTVRLPARMTTAARIVSLAACCVIVVLYAATLGSVLYATMAYCRPSCPSDLVGLVLPMLSMPHAIAAVAPRFRHTRHDDRLPLQARFESTRACRSQARIPRRGHDQPRVGGKLGSVLRNTPCDSAARGESTAAITPHPLSSTAAVLCCPWRVERVELNEETQQQERVATRTPIKGCDVAHGSPRHRSRRHRLGTHIARGIRAARRMRRHGVCHEMRSTFGSGRACIPVSVKLTPAVKTVAQVRQRACTMVASHTCAITALQLRWRLVLGLGLESERPSGRSIPEG